MCEHHPSTEAHPDPADTFTRRLIRRLIKAAGPVDEPTRSALTEVGGTCRPEVVDALATLLVRLRWAAPQPIAGWPVVAFMRYGPAEGVPAVRGTAITADGAGRYNVHSVFWDARTARWEAQNGRYGVEWDTARVELDRRADAEVQP